MKNESDFNISFAPRGTGWTIASLTVNGETTELRISDCMNDLGQVNALLWSLHHLSIMVDSRCFKFDLVEYVDDVKGFDRYGNPITEENKEDETTWSYVPRKASFVWDEEGRFSEWIFERDPIPTEEIDFDLHVTLNICHEEDKTYKFGIRYQKMCYIVAKACTEMLKKYGYNYYVYSSSEDLSLRSLIFLKAIALNRMDILDFEKIDGEENLYSSSFDKEMALLLEDM